jgi:hypothetical protein
MSGPSVVERVASIGRESLPLAGRRAGRDPAWAVALLWGLGVCIAHFGGLAFGIYYQIWWWDLLTHLTAGAGVAALIYLVAPATFRRPVALFVTLPLVVLAIGTWFEIYERVFRRFWVSWPRSYYVEDTVVDLVADVVGAFATAVVVVVVRSVRRLRRDRQGRQGD